MMKLETMQPDPTWEPEGVDDAIETFQAVATEVTIKVWGGDWCKDCTNQLPAFAAALQAAGIDPTITEHFLVEKDEDGNKHGPMVREYDISLIPTIVIERNGNEVARFVESAEKPAIVELANQLTLTRETHD